ncbi:MAG: immunity 49 family protein [Candidatus Gracilibacteria bacterium]|nr:immunity 49 family protein [Candidatus Gracilibacteria bacterium]
MSISTSIEKLSTMYVDSNLEVSLEKILAKVTPFNDYSDSFNTSIGSYLVKRSLYNFFVANELTSAKQYFYLFGKTVCIDVEVFDNKDALFLNVRDCVFVLLSGQLSLISKFSNLKDSEYKARLSKGALVPCIQAVIRDDWDFLASQITICRSKIAETKNGKWINSDLEVLEGIMEKDSEKIKNAIYVLANKEHKKRNDESILNELISIPALGYAKLAWLKGIEVEIDHPLIPKELLPVQPNEEYWEYDYMKEKEFKCN